MMMNYPLLKFSKRRGKLEPWGTEDTKLVVGQLLAVLVAWNAFCYCFAEEPNYIEYTVPASFVLSFWYMVFFGA